MENITFILTQEEASALLNVMGQLPTASNIHPLFIKMGTQYTNIVNPLTSTEEITTTENV